MLLLDENDIRSVFSMKDSISADEEAYRMFSAGRTETPLRPQIHTEDGTGDFLFMPAYSPEAEACAVKIVTSFPGNAEKGDDTTKGQVVLMDGKNGDITAVMDGTFVTRFRTGAASGAAFDTFAVRDASVGAMIGTGGQAECQLEAMLSACSLREVRIAARNYEKTKRFTAEMQEKMARFGARLIPCSDCDEAVSGADVITAVTVADKPVFSAASVKPGAVISAVGSYRPDMNEIDPDLFGRASGIYFDSFDACLAESGDIQIPLERGVISREDITGDIGECLNGKIPGRKSDEDIIIFKNVGIGALDLFNAVRIYEAARGGGVGTVWGE